METWKTKKNWYYPCDLSNCTSWGSKTPLICFSNLWSDSKKVFLCVCVFVSVGSQLYLTLKFLRRQTLALETLEWETASETPVFTERPPCLPPPPARHKHSKPRAPGLCRADIKEELAHPVCLLYCMHNDRQSQMTHADRGALGSVDTMVSALSNKAKNPDLRRTALSPPPEHLERIWCAVKSLTVPCITSVSSFFLSVVTR